MNGEGFRQLEIISILACFVGVVLISTVPSNPDDKYKNPQISQTVGVMVMVGVAANDAMIAVMARSMKDVHFTVIMFWFSAIGLVLISLVIMAIALFD